MRVELLSITPNAEALIAECARISHGADGVHTGIEKHRHTAHRCVHEGHYSVLEHASATFLVEGISRVCANQLTRHRHLSFTQESQRYVLSDRAFVFPMTYPVEFHADVHGVVQAAEAIYARMAAGGVPKEDARFLLPIGTGTRLAVTGNFHAWLKVLRTRLAKDSQWEIRDLAHRILEILYVQAPSVFADLYAEYH